MVALLLVLSSPAADLRRARPRSYCLSDGLSHNQCSGGGLVVRYSEVTAETATVQLPLCPDQKKKKKSRKKNRLLVIFGVIWLLRILNVRR